MILKVEVINHQIILKNERVDRQRAKHITGQLGVYYSNVLATLH